MLRREYIIVSGTRTAPKTEQTTMIQKLRLAQDYIKFQSQSGRSVDQQTNNRGYAAIDCA